MSSSSVVVDTEGHLATVTLNRPDTLNAVDAEMHDEIIGVFSDLSRDRSIRAIVLAAAGRVFSAGGDFDFMIENNQSLPARLKAMRDAVHLVEILTRINIPIIVAMHGHALGAGASLVLLTDAVVTHPRAKLGDPHVTMGLVAGDGGALAWPSVAGMLRARRYLLTGDSISGEQAYSWGLVTDLVDSAEEVLPEASRIATRIAQLPPLAVQGTKRALNQLTRARFIEVMEFSASEELITLGTRDLREAIGAFKQKRPGTFEGI